jgi:hypothetical protein
MRLPSKKRPGNQILAADWNLLIDALQARTPRPSHGMEIVSSSGGFSYRLRQVAGGGEGNPAEICPFGQITSWQEGATTKTGILGGLIHCGNQNWNMDSHPINLSITGDWLVYLAVSCSVHLDDDREILLPGVDSGTKPTIWSLSAGGGDYPPNSNPTPPSGSGTVILPVGRLVVAHGKASLTPAGCGNFTVTHCAGTLGYSRA